MAFRPAYRFEAELIDAELRRRQGGYGRGGRQRIETDRVEILTGIWQGTSIGSPIALQVVNKDYKLERMEDLDRPRPGHGDLTGAIKYLGSIRGVLERASARETTVRVAAGALAKQLLAEFGIRRSATWSSWAASRSPPQPGTLDEHRTLRDAERDLLARSRPRRRDQAADRRHAQGGRHAGRRRRGARRRPAVRPGHPRPVGPQARRPPGPGGDGRAGDQGRRDRPGLRSGAAARLAGPRPDPLRSRRSATARRWATSARPTTPAAWKPA